MTIFDRIGLVVLTPEIEGPIKSHHRGGADGAQGLFPVIHCGEVPYFLAIPDSIKPPIQVACIEHIIRTKQKSAEIAAFFIPEFPQGLTIPDGHHSIAALGVEGAVSILCTGAHSSLAWESGGETGLYYCCIIRVVSLAGEFFLKGIKGSVSYYPCYLAVQFEEALITGAGE